MTTRSQAGSHESHRKLDVDLNLALAKAAKESSVRVYVLISSANPRSSSRAAYSRMKGELEDAVEKLGFEWTAFVRPGLILGKREERRVGTDAMGDAYFYFSEIRVWLGLTDEELTSGLR